MATVNYLLIRNGEVVGEIEQDDKSVTALPPFNGKECYELVRADRVTGLQTKLALPTEAVVMEKLGLVDKRSVAPIKEVAVK